MAIRDGAAAMTRTKQRTIFLVSFSVRLRAFLQLHKTVNKTNINLNLHILLVYKVQFKYLYFTYILK